MPGLDLGRDSITYGDHASNSLLVSKAKHVELLHGNYSRVGFYHPGPYFFYVMAAGEFLFHDVLHISKSADAAHRLAIDLSNLILLGLVYRLFLKRTDARLLSALATLFGLSILLDQSPAITSVWPPNMYVVPAFLLAVSLWAAIRGHASGIWAAVLAAGILVHGHASNLGLMPLIFLGAVPALLIARKLRGEMTGVGYLWTWAKPAVFVALPIFGLFVLPYLTNTIVNWPGETPKYFSQSLSQPNPFFPAVGYVFSYWQGWIWLLAAGCLALFVLHPQKIAEASVEPKLRELRHDIIALVFVFLTTTAAMVFYAIKGIDDLQFPYIGIWYLGIVGAVMSISALILLRNFSGLTKAAAVATVLVIAFTNTSVFEAPPTQGLNDDGPAMDVIVAALQDNAGEDVIGLMLDAKDTWTSVWPGLIAVMDRSARLDGPQICILPENWHTLFHKEGKCTDTAKEDGIASGNLYIASVDDLPAAQFDKITDLSGLSLYNVTSIYRTRTDAFDSLNLADSSQKLKASLMLSNGWSSHDGPFVWQTEPTATLNISLPADGKAAILRIVMNGLPMNAGQTQTVTALLAGQTLGSFTLEPSGMPQEHRIQLPAVNSSAVAKISFTVDQLFSPVDIELSEDPRKVGMALQGFSIEPAR